MIGFFCILRRPHFQIANQIFKIMGQTLVKNYIHIVFSTKNRVPCIHPPVEQELHAYMGGICRDLDCPPIMIGGYTDHVHVLINLSKNIALTTLMTKLKSNSSKWVKSKGGNYKNFFWQNGYGAFSVFPSEVERVVKYIENQKEHHSKQSSKKEFQNFMDEHSMEYDERYIWD